MICLGIESTAHTFSVGIMNDTGNLLGLASDTYLPLEGGLKPSDVVEHHYAKFQDLLRQALLQAKIPLHQLNLIAFSRGPGLGPCLRIGAAVARSLALKLQIPIVGVNHCIGHIEIGRLMCKVEDPITLYVSGGNTIISAFDNGHYQIFGETLDIAIGNMLDMVARELGIPHPGGPRIEKMAKEGKRYFPIPYIVKGMDLSYSGLYSYIRNIIRQKFIKKHNLTVEDLMYSLQETSFSMLTEIFERAIAHTEKKTALLTGGVAANKRLQEMIAYVCAEHNTEFHVVPFKVAGDNGAMIAWAGILQYKSSGGESVDQTGILPKWRMDQVQIPWRTLKEKNFQNSEISKFEIKRKTNLDSAHFSIPSDEMILATLNISGKIIRKGAEAILISYSWFGRPALMKYRIPKEYRIKEVDDRFRASRTIIEARVLISLASIGFPVPLIYDIRPKNGILIMHFIEGQRVKDVLHHLSEDNRISIFYQIGKLVAQMHEADIAHGDLTTSNILITSDQMLYFIDFGLSQRDIDIEEKAMDIHLFIRVLQSTHAQYFDVLYPAFLDGYRDNAGYGTTEILQRVDKIALRGRYILKEQRRRNRSELKK